MTDANGEQVAERRDEFVRVGTSDFALFAAFEAREGSNARDFRDRESWSLQFEQPDPLPAARQAMGLARPNLSVWPRHTSLQRICNEGKAGRRRARLPEARPSLTDAGRPILHRILWGAETRSEPCKPGLPRPKETSLGGCRLLRVARSRPPDSEETLWFLRFSTSSCDACFSSSPSPATPRSSRARDRGPPSRARHPPGASPSAATPRACWPATSSPSTRSSQRGSTVRKLLHEAGARARGLESGARLRGPRFGPPTGRSWPLRAREPPRARRSMVVLRLVVLLVLFLLRQVVVLGGRTL